MKLEVLTTVWGADGDEYAGGLHDDVKLTGKLAPLIAGAEAAGTVRILDATAEERAKLDRHVQSQEDGEAAYAQAQGKWVPPVYELVCDDDGNEVGRTLTAHGYWSGAWHEGNLLQHELDKANPDAPKVVIS